MTNKFGKPLHIPFLGQTKGILVIAYSLSECQRAYMQWQAMGSLVAKKTKRNTKLFNIAQITKS